MYIKNILFGWVLLFVLLGCNPTKSFEIIENSIPQSNSACTSETVFSGNNLENITSVRFYNSVRNIAVNYRVVKNQLIIEPLVDDHCISGESFWVFGSENHHQIVAHKETIQNEPVEKKDFRSPKTIITDSLVDQQSITYQLGKNQQLILNDNEFAQESYYKFSPIDKTMRAIENQPRTAFYIESGSAQTIPLEYRINTHTIELNTPPLQDAFGNSIKEGTLASIIIKNRNQERIIRTYVKKGKIHKIIELEASSNVQIQLQIGKYYSPKINVAL